MNFKRYLQTLLFVVFVIGVIIFDKYLLSFSIIIYGLVGLFRKRIAGSIVRLDGYKAVLWGLVLVALGLLLFFKL
jgi:hypothetical protein